MCCFGLIWVPPVQISRLCPIFLSGVLCSLAELQGCLGIHAGPFAITRVTSQSAAADFTCDAPW